MSLLWNPTAAPRKDVAIPIQRNTKKSHLFRCKKNIWGVIWKPIRTACSKQLNTNMQMVQVLVLLQKDIERTNWIDSSFRWILKIKQLYSPFSDKHSILPKRKKKYLILVPSKEKILKTTGRAEQLNRHLSSQQKIIPDVKINVKHRNIHICIVPFQHSLISTGSDDQTARHNAYMLDNVWTS